MIMNEYTSRPQRKSGSMFLPSIRQAFPEFDSSFRERPTDHERDSLPRTPPSTTPPNGAHSHELTRTPEYTISPTYSKRIRLSPNEGRESKSSSQVPRPYGSLQQFTASVGPPSYQTWDNPNPDRSNVYIKGDNSPPQPTALPANTRRSEQEELRPTLPSIPTLNFGRGFDESCRIQGHTRNEYPVELHRRHSFAPGYGPGIDLGGHEYRPPGIPHNYSYPSNPQSLPIRPADPNGTPYPTGQYTPYLPRSHLPVGDYSMVVGNEINRTRRRRGNLPKETTDKLRSWFVSHLHHPYPTEDEKQEFMRQTGLQINQISNWFINARRRQLPTMINDAEVESKARKNHAANNKTPSSDKSPDCGGEGSDRSEFEIESRERKRSNIKRKSV
ncbi:homeobox KN domain-containing protein [Xylaria palmicola]|nr:homeobox KN domain-containing protein [Xylaria palmicola]